MSTTFYSKLELFQVVFNFEILKKINSNIPRPFQLLQTCKSLEDSCYLSTVFWKKICKKDVPN